MKASKFSDAQTAFMLKQGKAGIAEFTELRWITVQTTPRRYPF